MYRGNNKRGAKRDDAAAPKTSWNKVAKSYGAYMKSDDTFQEAIVFPGALRLLAPKSGKTYLDVGCGEGTFANLVAKGGALVTGVDAARDLVLQAQNKAAKGTKFLIGNAERMHEVLGSALFDGAACILAVQNMSNLDAVTAQTGKALKPGAPFVVVMNHPAFRIPRQSSWGVDEEKKLMYRRVDMYMTESEIPIQAHPGSAPSVRTFSYHRPLSAYVTSLSKAGFMVGALEEWTSHRESDSGPRAKAENRSRNEIPMFMAIRPVKK